MAALPENLYTAAQLRDLDRRAVERAGIPARDLMQRAGEAAWRIAAMQWPGTPRVLVLCGAGNNAGDGYVLASEARSSGRDVTVLALGDAARLPEAAAAMRKRYLDAGGAEQPFKGKLPATDLLVDALLGIGIDRPLQAEWLKAVQAVNASGLPVLSLDIPTGLNADTGAEMGAAVRATVTVTFYAP
jgi:NAD(P)H-hydrate epimerase